MQSDKNKTTAVTYSSYHHLLCVSVFLMNYLFLSYAVRGIMAFMGFCNPSIALKKLQVIFQHC